MSDAFHAIKKFNTWYGPYGMVSYGSYLASELVSLFKLFLSLEFSEIEIKIKIDKYHTPVEQYGTIRVNIG